jgi:hypothetical protein
MPGALLKTAIRFISFNLLLFSSPFLAAQGGYDATSPIGITESDVLSRCNAALENAKIVQSLSESDLATLPVVLIKNPAIVIAIDSAYSTEKGWFFSAYASVMLPGTTKPIAFAARNIAFNKGGLTTASQSRLRLEFPINGSNFLDFDCNGFKAINLKGNFVFSSELIVPDDEIVQDKEVTASFEINTSNINNIMVSVNITPFMIRGIDVSFQVKNATADFSDIANPPGLSLPQEYQQELGSDIQLWRGFYLEGVDIRIKYLASSPKLDPVIMARNLLLDERGVTGSFSAMNLTSLDNGSADGWPMAIDAFGMKLLFNRITGGSLSGLISVPFLGDDPLPYTALIEHVDNVVNYSFAVTITEGKDYNTPLSATIQIDPGSVIALERRNKKFMATAKLQGKLTVKNNLLNIKGVSFQDLELSSRKPFIKGGVFSTIGNGGSKAGGFPLSIDSIGMRVFQGQAGISIGVSLNLMDKGFAASTTVQLLAKMEEKTTPADPENGIEEKKTHKWKFDKVKFNDVKISSETKAIYLAGSLSIYDNDPTYGNGFGGSLAFKINSIMQNPAKVTAFFGSKDTFRYWHLDAYVPTKIPIGPVITINGMQGGASYHMKRLQPFTPDFTKLEADAMTANTPQNTQSAFVPDETTGMAFMAGITLIVKSDAAVNADALFEVAFNNNGGLRYVQFTGSAFFFTPSGERERVKGKSVPQAPVFANLNMLYDNDNKVFHANLKTYLNVAGILRGTGPNNLVGEAVIHADPKDFYIYVGRPTQMFGITIAGLATAQTYFMMGTQVEDIPPPPAEVQEIFGKIDPGLKRDGAALAGGRGFATGAHLRVGFDSGSKLRPFYIVVVVGAGADIMLRDYGDAQCEGRSGKIGVDGWFASGQAYVFLKGKVGIRVKGNDFDIISVGAAALLQAKLPNPTWMKGQLGGSYSVMGGLVKGKFNLKLVIGDECEIVGTGSEIDDIKVIEDIKPDINSTDVSVFAAPQVSFNTSLNKEFSMADLKDNVNYYRVKLGEFTITKNGSPQIATLEMNATNDVAILRTKEILPQQSTLNVIVKIFWEKKVGNGPWQTMKKQNGEVIYEVKETTFTTGIAPAFIPEENVAYSYPTKNQYNFYTNETGTGYVKLKMGQSYLFEQATGGTQWMFVARFQNVQGQQTDVPLTYNTGETLASFQIPSELSKQAIYKLTFVKRPASSGAIDQNVQRSQVTTNEGQDNEMTIASNTLQGTITQGIEKDLYASAFRTSQFGKFEEKIATLSNSRDLWDVAVGNIAVIGKRAELTETFDAIELKGKEGQTKSLVQVTASPENTWLKSYISPTLYDQYPSDKDVTITWREPETLGIKPLRGVSFTNDQGDYGLTDTNVTTGTAPVKSGSVLIGYYLSFYSFKDYHDLRNKAAAKFLKDMSGAPAGIKTLLTSSFVDLIEGSYPVQIAYVLPGTNQVTYSKELTIKY